MTTATITAAPTLPDQALLPISILAFNSPSCRPVDIYLQRAGNGYRRLYAAATHFPKPVDFERLSQSGIKSVFIRGEQWQAFNKHLEGILASGAELPGEVRLAIAKEVAKANFAEAWRKPTNDPLVEMAMNLADTVMTVCTSQFDLDRTLQTLLGHDGSTFAHVTNVCIYSMLLAMNMGVSSPETLREVGIAGLLHDIGKRGMLTSPLKRPGKMSAQERNQLRAHPTKGFQELCLRNDMTRGQLMMVYQHHERLDGSGYPVRVPGSEIHWMAQLCAVVDSFDTLTGHRGFERPATAEEALEYLRSRTPHQFNAEMVDCWSNVLSDTLASCA